MGFGDVTLMAMIGAGLGWQAGLLIFFLAPFAGIVIGVSLLIVRREHEIAYGPFLCLAALCTILWWPKLWLEGHDLFALGWYVPVVLAIVLVLLGVMLAVWQAIKKWLVGSG
jgi:Flp pilus assembly protein protease CpaA